MGGFHVSLVRNTNVAARLREVSFKRGENAQISNGGNQNVFVQRMSFVGGDTGGDWTVVFASKQQYTCIHIHV